MVLHFLQVASHAMRVVPDPPNRSRTVSSGSLEFSRARETNSTGFIMGCSSEDFGRGNSQTSSWRLSTTGCSLAASSFQP